MSVARERGRLLLADSLLRQLIGVPVDTCRALLGAHCGAGLALERLFDTADRHLHAAVTAGRLRRKPGVTAVIEALERQRLPYGIATSSSRARAHHHLAASRLLGGMRVVVTRDDVQRGKPHPDLYLRAAGQLGVAPQRCLAFEDSYNGVRAAAAAGMPVVMVPDLLPATDEMQATALTVIGSLADLMPGLAERATPGAARR